MTQPHVKQDKPTPSPGPRGRRNAGLESGRDALLRCALVCFARYGYEGTSLRLLAAEAHVDMALVGRLFGSKASLWEAVIEQLAQRLVVWSVPLNDLAALSRHDPRAAVIDFFEAFVNISIEMPALPAFLMHEANNPGDRHTVLATRIVGPFRSYCRPMIAAAMAAGIVRGTDPDIVLAMIFSAISIPILSPAMFVEGSPRDTDALGRSLFAETTAIFVNDAPV